MNLVAVPKELFPAKAGEPGEGNWAVQHDSNVVGIFDGGARPIKSVPARQVRMPASATPEVAAAREMLGRRFYRHMTLPAIGGVTEFGNLLVGSIGALVNTPLRDRFSFSLKLCSACIVDSQQAATLAFVISEILINTLQYADPTDGRISIKIACSPGRDGKTTIDVCDDDVGLPRGFEERIAAKGIMVIRFRLQAIGANMVLESNDLGIGYQIELPPPVSQNAMFHAPLSNFGAGVY